MAEKHQSIKRSAAAALALAGLLFGSAAALADDDMLSRFLVAPGRYVLFNCQQIAQQSKTNIERQRELEGLIAKAGPGGAGQMVSAFAYRPEYLQLRGEMADLRQAASDKKCKSAPGESGGRALGGAAIR